MHLRNQTDFFTSAGVESRCHPSPHQVILLRGSTTHICVREAHLAVLFLHQASSKHQNTYEKAHRPGCRKSWNPCKERVYQQICFYQGPSMNHVSCEQCVRMPADPTMPCSFIIQKDQQSATAETVAPQLQTNEVRENLSFEHQLRPLLTRPLCNILWQVFSEASKAFASLRT